jgi:hypothetical protein
VRTRRAMSLCPYVFRELEVSYESADCDTCCDRWDGAGSDVTCDPAPSGQGAEEESDVIERLRVDVSRLNL